MTPTNSKLSALKQFMQEKELSEECLVIMAKTLLVQKQLLAMRNRNATRYLKATEGLQRSDFAPEGR